MFALMTAANWCGLHACCPSAEAAPGDKLPAQHQITAELGISPATARRACRELTRLGLIRHIPGHGYYPGSPA
jgi:DNA-binding GntR family transcriptional regulator